ncbi:unnamed protein product [Rotaria magnacalcarata]|uniref:Antistasin-like domain-containing protein n=4 Tax=Rotaria magnacalcarata TaxID=392030 RepID=A0A816WD11_9BILA|nr:unnamed protein product [Rotaria magnacalcarata]CAF1366449.1 unnamed protein product [Rotaria magnacalcarata]CAF2076757.1 unnamed protein product [Rotaria magnacalcarata]CAF2131598.1 unnamed protein product [Rotaria magnacalcarata]CAF2249822.1 unnamed protein product [Rotaria magnacalcarata]
MYSMGIVFAMLFVVFSTTATNALICKPVTCMLACPYGFASDVNGCPHCSCRKTENVCIEPIIGYNCGSVDHRDCPSSHECRLTFSTLHGECCLKTFGSSTARPSTGITTAFKTTSRPVTGTSTARMTTSRPVTGTTTARMTTDVTRTPSQRPLHMLLAFSTGSATTGHATTGSATGSPASTTPSSFTTGRGTGSPTATSRRF